MEQLAHLKAALDKAEARLNRLKMQLESAQTERDELATAIKVLERYVTNGPSNERPAPTENGEIIFKYVPIGQAGALAPRDIIERMRSDGKMLGDDLIRTQLWRMAKRGEILKEDGRYWRSVPRPAFDDDLLDDEQAVPLPPPLYNDDDLDDIPF